jgi:hypothetical protein
MAAHPVNVHGHRTSDCHDLVHVDVADAGGDTVPHVRCRLPAEGGRGLMLIEMTAYRWGVYEYAAGRKVWFQVKYEQEAPTAVVSVGVRKSHLNGPTNKGTPFAKR